VRGVSSRVAGFRIYRFLRAREVHPERSPRTGLAVYFDAAAAVAHDPEDDR
jgi:hypothetical protein